MSSELQPGEKWDADHVRRLLAKKPVEPVSQDENSETPDEDDDDELFAGDEDAELV